MSLFVGNLWVNVDPNKLKEIFSEHGHCKIDLKKKYAFIDYDDEDGWKSAEQAILNLHNTNLQDANGRYKCNVEWSSKKERPPQVANSKSVKMPPVKNLPSSKLNQKAVPSKGEKDIQSQFYQNQRLQTQQSQNVPEQSRDRESQSQQQRAIQQQLNRLSNKRFEEARSIEQGPRYQSSDQRKNQDSHMEFRSQDPRDSSQQFRTPLNRNMRNFMPQDQMRSMGNMRQISSTMSRDGRKQRGKQKTLDLQMRRGSNSRQNMQFDASKFQSIQQQIDYQSIASQNLQGDQNQQQAHAKRQQLLLLQNQLQEQLKMLNQSLSTQQNIGGNNSQNDQNVNHSQIDMPSGSRNDDQMMKENIADKEDTQGPQPVLKNRNKRRRESSHDHEYHSQRDEYLDPSHNEKEQNIGESNEQHGHEKNQRVKFLDEEECFESRDSIRDRKRDRDQKFNNISVKIQRNDDNCDAQLYLNSGSRPDQKDYEHINDSPKFEKKRDSKDRQKEYKSQGSEFNGSNMYNSSGHYNHRDHSYYQPQSNSSYQSQQIQKTNNYSNRLQSKQSTTQKYIPHSSRPVYFRDKMNENKAVANILEVVKEYVKMQTNYNQESIRQGKGAFGLGTRHCKMRVLSGRAHRDTDTHDPHDF